jgi:hypothetical protein
LDAAGKSFLLGDARQGCGKLHQAFHATQVNE